MKKIIDKLWRGDISPYVALGKDDAELESLKKILMESLDELQGDHEKNGRIFDNCYESATEYAERLAQIAFSDGFSLGVKLMAEAFCKETPCE